MRIFYSTNTSPNAVFKSDLWRNNLYLPLVELGHDVVEFDYDLYDTFKNVNSDDPGQREFIERNRPKVTAELLRQIKAAHSQRPIDLFFSYFYDACVLPEAIDEIRSMGITTVNWYCNGSYQLHLVSEISPRYDWCLVPEKFRLSDYKAMGANPIYCQEAANPNFYKPYDLPVEFNVTFVGQAYGERPALIRYLLDSDIDVRVWGLGWRENFLDRPVHERPFPLRRASHIARRLMTVDGWHAALRRVSGQLRPAAGAVATQPTPLSFPDHMLGGVLSDQEMVQMYSRSKINLGFSSCWGTSETGERVLQVRLRDFEVPMSGGFYMVEYMEELEEFFEIGKEIVCYSGPEDLADKINYYLRHDGEREAIRQAGRERCLRDHTWHRRFELAFKQMGFS